MGKTLFTKKASKKVNDNDDVNKHLGAFITHYAGGIKLISSHFCPIAPSPAVCFTIYPYILTFLDWDMPSRLAEHTPGHVHDGGMASGTVYRRALLCSPGNRRATWTKSFAPSHISTLMVWPWSQLSVGWIPLKRELTSAFPFLRCECWVLWPTWEQGFIISVCLKAILCLFGASDYLVLHWLLRGSR